MDKQNITLGKILSIGGKPGLYKMIAQAKNGVIVESLLDQKRLQAFAHDKISSLDEISVFTQTDDKPLKEVFKLIHQATNGGPAPDTKAESPELLGFFEQVLPEYDRERVYVSHIKKIFSWYNLLLEKDLLVLEDEETKETDEATTEQSNPTGEGDELK